MRAAEVAERLGFGDWGRAWAAGLEAFAPPPGGLAPLVGEELRERLVGLGLEASEIDDVVATAPTPDGSPEWWWLLERCCGRLVATMGDPVAERGPWPDWVGPRPSFERRCFFVHVFVATMPFTLRWHRLQGIPGRVTRDSLNDLARHMELHRRMYGSTGVDNAWWLTLCLRGELFELGRLQFNQLRMGGGDEAPPWYPEEEVARRGDGFRVGDAGVGVHIPESGPMTPEACDDSFARAGELFARCLPLPGGQRRRLATCQSWLLDDQLAEWLPAESNIVRFQRRFELVPGLLPGDHHVVGFVFRRPVPGGVVDEGLVASLPQRTRLERAIVTHLRQGGHWYERVGWTDLVEP